MQSLKNVLAAGVLSLIAGGLKRTVRTDVQVRGLMQEAFLRNLAIEVTYTDADGHDTSRVIEVTEITNEYIRTYCRKAKNWRTFRFERIHTARWTGEVYTPREFSNKAAETKAVSA